MPVGQPGSQVTITAPYTLASSGLGVLVSGLFGVSQAAIVSGASGLIFTEGVFSLTKVSAQAWSVGDWVYWDDTNRQCSNENSVGRLIGVCVEAAANRTSTGVVKLCDITERFGWRDLIGDLSNRTGGGTNPTIAVFRGGVVVAPFFSTGNNVTMSFHIPHDYVVGSDLFLHLHWAHNGTAISGSLVVTYSVTYSKGHNQAEFPSEISPVLTVSTPNIATVPQYRHRVDEIQLSAASPSATQLNSALIEVDGLLFIGLTATTIPTITGGSTNRPALLFCDLHYQSNSNATKNKAPNFYT